MMNTSKSRTDQCCESEFEDWEEKAGQLAKLCSELENEVNRLRSVLSNPGMLRYHTQKQFPEYEWIDRQHYADLRRLAEEAERMIHSQNSLDGEPSI